MVNNHSKQHVRSSMCPGRKKSDSGVRKMGSAGVQVGRSGLHHYGMVRDTER